MNYDVLLVIDVQTALVEGHPPNETLVIDNIKRLLGACRAKGVPVIYIQHDGGSGDEVEHGCPGWEIYRDIAPLPGETVIEKRYNSAFRRTGLRAHLEKMGAKNLILCGMQTEYCVDATCKVAFEYGYDVTIAHGTTTTFDSDFASGERLTAYYENAIWDGRYARVLPMDRLLFELNG